ncbi:hypothetical protein SH580_13125 [Coraliomargarita algicola]|uniref:Uncharacterized protein n=1 Tax=Coraliomargarita algicola TaxID=3092156 RepID=A0ABZ0RH72_9BACT|nr:hypothetical protein [Coraliomargarita sp. J2-16]WPJ94375.1 hypothetical protein SH580_13125 [Coraliomargarita sp. J2-16]
MSKNNTDDLRARRNGNSPVEGEDLLVTRELLSQATEPPIKKTTFHKLVRKGVIVQCAHIKGRYYMNKSRARMKLPPLDVSRVRAEMQALAGANRNRELLFAAMAVLVEEAVVVFSGEAKPENVTPQEAQYVADLVVLHGRKLDGSGAPIPDRFVVDSEFSEITKIEDPIQRVAYVRGVLDGDDSLSKGITNCINR